jgi:hypothetical protein
MAEVQSHTQAGEMTQVFIEFVMQQAQNAALFLGQIPDPRRGQVEVNLPLAKMFIDQLAVVRERTSGNLHADEKKVIDSAVTELQHAYAEVAQVMRAQNVGGEPPPALLTFAASAAPLPAAAPAPAPAPVAELPKAAPAPEAPKPAEPEESRKRFTKSYGS